MDWPTRLNDALNPTASAWTKLTTASRHGLSLRGLAFATPPTSVDLDARDLVLGDLNLRNVLFDEARGGEVSGLVDVETTLGFGCRSIDLAPLLVDWHRADVRFRVDPAASPPDPAVAEVLRREIRSIGGQALLTAVVIHRLVEGANWAVDHGLEHHLPFWCLAAGDALRPDGRGCAGHVPRARRPDPVAAQMDG